MPSAQRRFFEVRRRQLRRLNVKLGRYRKDGRGAAVVSADSPSKEQNAD
jgi:hypothetical protein